MEKRLRSDRPLLALLVERAEATGARLAALVLSRAVDRAAKSTARRSPGDTHLLRDIGLASAEVERLASELLVLTADPFHISLKHQLPPAAPSDPDSKSTQKRAITWMR
jgi:hypothetical protein